MRERLFLLAKAALALAAAVLLVQLLPPLELSARGHTQARGHMVPDSADSNTWALGRKSNCSNIFVITSEWGGLGHRMSAFAMGLAFAMDAGAGIALDDRLLSMERLQDAASYPFLRHLFNLYKFPLASEIGFKPEKPDDGIAGYRVEALRYEYMPTDHAMDAVDKAQRVCRKVMVVRTGHDGGCRAENGAMTYCVLVGVPGAYQKAKTVLSWLYGKGFYSRLPLHHFAPTVAARTPTLAVAWFVRNDDISIRGGEKAYWTSLVSSVTDSLLGVPAHHYIISQHEIKATDANFGFLHDIGGWKWTSLHALPVPDATYHMIAADVLVHSGSSFSLAAGLASPSSQVQLFHLPKESKGRFDPAWNTYWMEGCVEIPWDGIIPAQDRQVVRTKAIQRLASRPAQWAESNPPTSAKMLLPTGTPV